MAHMKEGADLRILVDTIKDPRDFAELVHLAMATDRTVDVTGNSIHHAHPKVAGVINSWKPGFREHPELARVHYSQDFFERVKALKAQGYQVIGTSPNFGDSLFESNFSKGKQVVVFGTEVGGLSKAKIGVLDKVVRVPMTGETRFYTLRTVIPVVVHEMLRQKGFFGKPRSRLGAKMVHWRRLAAAKLVRGKKFSNLFRRRTPSA